MSIFKVILVILNGVIQIGLTADTFNSGTLEANNTTHDASGSTITGTCPNILGFSGGNLND